MWKNLANMGFKSYAEYFESGQWREKRAEYNRSNLPQGCLVCAHNKFELYHRDFSRIGNEFLMDLIPLCWKCRNRVQFMFERKGVKNIYKQKINHGAVQEAFGFEREKVNRIFAPVSICEKTLRWMPKNEEELTKLRRLLGPVIFDGLNFPALFPWRKNKKDSVAKIAIEYVRNNSELRRGQYGTELWIFDEEVGDYVFCVTLIPKELK